MLRIIKVGVNEWRKVEGVMIDGNSSRSLKEKVLSYCVVPASIHGLETVEQQKRRINE